jgi:hypothetical protein
MEHVRSMSPASIHYYNDWSSLNYMYGVVNISYHEDAKVKIQKKKKKNFFGIRLALCKPHSQRSFFLLAEHVLECG